MIPHLASGKGVIGASLVSSISRHNLDKSVAADSLASLGAAAVGPGEAGRCCRSQWEQFKVVTVIVSLYSSPYYLSRCPRHTPPPPSLACLSCLCFLSFCSFLFYFLISFSSSVIFVDFRLFFYLVHLFYYFLSSLRLCFLLQSVFLVFFAFFSLSPCLPLIFLLLLRLLLFVCCFCLSFFCLSVVLIYHIISSTFVFMFVLCPVISFIY